MGSRSTRVAAREPGFEDQPQRALVATQRIALSQAQPQVDADAFSGAPGARAVGHGGHLTTVKRREAAAISRTPRQPGDGNLRAAVGRHEKKIRHDAQSPRPVAEHPNGNGSWTIEVLILDGLVEGDLARLHQKSHGARRVLCPQPSVERRRQRRRGLSWRRRRIAALRMPLVSRDHRRCQRNQHGRRAAREGRARDCVSTSAFDHVLGRSQSSDPRAFSRKWVREQDRILGGRKREATSCRSNPKSARGVPIQLRATCGASSFDRRARERATPWAHGRVLVSQRGTGRPRGLEDL